MVGADEGEDDDEEEEAGTEEVEEEGVGGGGSDDKDDDCGGSTYPLREPGRRFFLEGARFRRPFSSRFIRRAICSSDSIGDAGEETGAVLFVVILPLLCKLPISMLSVAVFLRFPTQADIGRFSCVRDFGRCSDSESNR